MVGLSRTLGLHLGYLGTSGAKSDVSSAIPISYKGDEISHISHIFEIPFWAILGFGATFGVFSYLQCKI